MNFDVSNYDFIDFGCSQGDSLKYGIDVFGAKRGLGIDIDPIKVQKTKEKGFEAIVGDVNELSQSKNLKKSVDFVLMIHFLEHLQGYDLAKECINSASEIARDFIFIRQPYFDSDSYLFRKGFKNFWADWRGHRYHMTSFDFYRILMPMKLDSKIKNFTIFGNYPTFNSNDVHIHPLESPIDQHSYDEIIHPFKKKDIPFLNVFKQIEVIITLSGKNSIFDIFEKLKDGNRSILFDSSP